MTGTTRILALIVGAVFGLGAFGVSYASTAYAFTTPAADLDVEIGIDPCDLQPEICDWDFPVDPKDPEDPEEPGVGPAGGADDYAPETTTTTVPTDGPTDDPTEDPDEPAGDDDVPAAEPEDAVQASPNFTG